jgi:hypothetical protein
MQQADVQWPSSGRERAEKERPTVERLVESVGGPTAAARLIGPHFKYQLVQQWLGRGYASPKYYQQLAKHLPDGLTIDDLFADLQRAKKAA